MWQYKEGKKLKPKPNYNSVDLSEVEWEDTEEKVSKHTLTQTFLSFLIASYGIYCIFGFIAVLSAEYVMSVF